MKSKTTLPLHPAKPLKGRGHNRIALKIHKAAHGPIISWVNDNMPNHIALVHMGNDHQPVISPEALKAYKAAHPASEIDYKP